MKGCDTMSMMDKFRGWMGVDDDYDDDYDLPDEKEVEAVSRKRIVKENKEKEDDKEIKSNVENKDSKKNIKDKYLIISCKYFESLGISLNFQLSKCK